MISAMAEASRGASLGGGVDARWCYHGVTEQNTLISLVSQTAGPRSTDH